jgi:LysR family transcriptional regulator, glycine cleavage system transcriptional activator
MQKDPQRLPQLDRLAVFDAAARQLSFTKAAAERFLTQSAVSRQIAALESELGTPLFRRRHRGLSLTDEGQRLAAAVADALTGLRAAVAEVRAPQRRAVVALTTTPGLASLWLIPRLAGFVGEHPGIDVRIDASHLPRRLAAEGFDVAIRYCALGSDAGVPLFEEAVHPVCAPALLKRGAPPLKVAADLRGHTLLQSVATPEHGMPLDWPSWLQAAGAGDVEPAATLTFTSYDTAVAAAVAGQGVVLGRRPLIDRLLRQRALVAPFKGQTASARGYFLIVEPTAGRRTAVQALAEWLKVQARQ